MDAIETFVTSQLQRLRLPEHPFRWVVPILAVFVVFMLVGPLTLLLFGIIAGEIFILYRGQREVLGWSWSLLPKPLLYVLVMPGVVAHELSHVLACFALMIKPTRINWFRPEKDEFGQLTLGSVQYVETGVKRQTLIASAPLWLLPLLLVGWSMLMLGAGVISDPLAALTSAPIWKLVIWAIVCLSAGQAAFPSVEDPIPGEGGFTLGLLAVLGILISGTAYLVVLMLLLPTVAAAALWLGLRLMMHRKGLKPRGSQVAGVPGRSEYMCSNCLHIQPAEGNCERCQKTVFYKLSASGYVTEFSPDLGVKCQSCGHKHRRLFLRSYRGVFGETGQRRVIRRIGGYWCDQCVHRRFWKAERQIAFKVWSVPIEIWTSRPLQAALGTVWLTIGPGALLRKTLNLLLNIPGEMAAPFNLAGAGAVHADQIIERKQAADAAQDDAAPGITPAPGWWVALSPGDQRLVLADADYYAILGVQKDAPMAAIKRAYRRRAQAAHPDHGGSNEQMQAVVGAWDVLQDEALRYAYDHRSEIPPEYRNQTARA